jgi:nuclear pore complex protein Nup93
LARDGDSQRNRGAEAEGKLSIPSPKLTTQTVKAFQNHFQQRILSSWEHDKARVLQEELGVTDDELARFSSSVSASTGNGASSSRLGASLGPSALGASRLGASTRRFPLAQSTLGKTSVESREGGLVMHNKAIKYEKVVNNLNQHRLRKEPFEVCQAFEATVKGDQKNPLLPSAFRLLANITQEPSLRTTSTYPAGGDFSLAEPVLQRQYASAYLARSGQTSVLLRGRLTMGARQYLERDFETHIDDTIARNPKEAALGGVPGIANKVRAYVDVTLRAKDAQDAYRPETVGGIKLWAHVYYLLRAGYPSEALQLVETHQHNVKKDDWSFPGSFKAYLSSTERRLPKAQRDQLYNDFNAHVRNNANVDQFKYALYKLVGRFELARKHAKVASTTEDWVWFQLGLTRENKDGDAPQEQYDLADLARVVLKYGADKFDANGTRPFAWFNLLLFTAQFERAVAYLYSKPALKTDAVHFAVALQYYGLLRVPAKSSDADICKLFSHFSLLT